MIYLVFNEGYSARATRRERARRWRRGDPAGALLLRCSRRARDHGAAALMLLQHARAAARFDAEGSIVLLEDQDQQPLGTGPPSMKGWR
jgi:RNA polymerase sigma-70 factor (ECF subfamily)